MSLNPLKKVQQYNWGINENWKLEIEHAAERTWLNADDDFALKKKPQTKDPSLINRIKYVPTKYIPGKLVFPTTAASTLSRSEQAASLDGLVHIQNNNDKQPLKVLIQKNLEMYNSLKPKIQEEHLTFSTYAEKEWNKKWKRANHIPAVLRRYACNMWEGKLQLVHKYPQFYSLCEIMIPLSSETDKVEVTHLQNVLRVGEIPEFAQTSFLVKCVLDSSTLPVLTRKTYNSKLPVSQDANIDEIVKNHNVDIVISTSAMKTFMDNSNYRNEWDIPIIIKQVRQKLDDNIFTNKNVIYVDKTLPKRFPSNVAFNEYCHKRLIRSEFCKYSMHLQSSSEEKVDNPYYNKDSSQFRMDCTGNKEQDSSSKDLPVFYNATYDIWKIRWKMEDYYCPLMKVKAYPKDINVLIRCKVDGYEVLDSGITQQVTISPKLEYQLELGANIATKQELIREWTSLFFKPYSHLYRIRTQANTSEVVSIESVNLQKINFEAMNCFECKPCDRLNSVYKVFLELLKYEPGNYLLHHTGKHGPFAQLLKTKEQCINRKACDTYDLHTEYSRTVCRPVEAKKEWCPINVNYVLPIHINYRRLPGTFQPRFTLRVKGKLKNRRHGAKRKPIRGSQKKKNPLQKKKTAATHVCATICT